MRGKAELVKRRDRPDFVAAADENARVAGEAVGVAGNRDDQRRPGGGERARLRLGPGARRVEQHGVEARQLRPGQRPAEEVASSRLWTRAQARSPRRRRASARATAAASESTAKTSWSRARRSAKAPAPQNRSATRSAPRSAAAAPLGRAPASPAAVACRKPPGGGIASTSPNSDLGRPSLDDRLAVDRQARQIELFGGDGELAPRQRRPASPEPRRSKSSPPSVAVAWMSSGLADAAHRAGERVGGGGSRRRGRARTADRRRSR